APQAGEAVGGMARGEPPVKGHVGAVEQWIALAQHRDRAAGVEVAGDGGGAGVVEFTDPAAVTRIAGRNLRRHRIAQRQLGDAGLEMAGGDRAGMTGIAVLGEVHDPIRFFECAHRLQRDQLGIARADADADELGGSVHSPALASALTAAAVMALPPMRPRTIRNGTPRGSAASASFASAAPTKP